MSKSIAYQAITTKYFPAVGRRTDAVIKATAQAGYVYHKWDDDLDPSENHAKAAYKLARKYGWWGNYFTGGMPNGNGNVYVCVDDKGGYAFTIHRNHVTETQSKAAA